MNEYNLSTIERADFEKMNKADFTAEEFQGYSIKAVLAHLIECSSKEDVQSCLDSIDVEVN